MISFLTLLGGFLKNIYQCLRFTWTFSVAITTGPRIVFCRLQQTNLSEKYSSFRCVIKLNYYLNLTEILSLLTLSLVSSSDIFILHAAAFSIFILTSLISMTLVTYYIKDVRNQEFKRNIVTISWCCVFLAAYFYNRHNEYCEPFIYSGFAVCEYLVVGCNMAWHGRVVSQFTGYRLTAEPHMDLR